MAYGHGFDLWKSSDYSDGKSLAQCPIFITINQNIQ